MNYVDSDSNIWDLTLSFIVFIIELVILQRNNEHM